MDLPHAGGCLDVAALCTEWKVHPGFFLIPDFHKGDGIRLPCSMRLLVCPRWLTANRTRGSAPLYERCIGGHG